MSPNQPNTLPQSWYKSFKNSYLTEFFINWPTYRLINVFRRNSIMAIAIALISSLLNVTSSWDVPFRQLQWSHHGSTIIYCCTPFLSLLVHRWQFAVRALWLWCKTRVSAEPAGAFFLLFVELFNMFEQLEAKHSVMIHHDQVTHPL